MIILLFIIIAFLLVLNLVQYKNKKDRDKSLKYISSKINEIINNKTSEKLMVFTHDSELINILKEINNLLNYNQSIIAEFNKTEISMRKMLSNISHDLKTPLTVISGYIETITLDPNISNEERNLLLSKVQNKTIELLELINKFFDLAKLESGDMDIKLSRININEVCKKNLLVFYDVLNSKGIEVSINIANEQLYSLANEEALDRIINNLISNAIKYGLDGKILGLDLRHDEHYIYIDIWDKGKGISENFRDKVFERMYTLEDSRNKNFQGSGLGLTITKRLTEALNGDITLTSVPYNKTTFTVKLKKLIY